ncbi:YchJ family protein [Brachymonas denitrificans]|nr:YchJ family metal-binding protein [Brachymonas denitrificans]
MSKRKNTDWLQAPCPCGRQSPQHKPLSGADCCGRYLEHFMDVPAPDAESLMRSRYTAFVLGRTAYLLATWLPDNRPGQLEAEQGTQWLGLAVRDHSQPDADHAEVEFVARYRINGRAERLHERSRFVRLEDGAMSRWLYVDGDML